MITSSEVPSCLTPLGPPWGPKPFPGGAARLIRPKNRNGSVDRGPGCCFSTCQPSGPIEAVTKCHHPTIPATFLGWWWMMDGWCRNHLLRYLYNRVSNMLSLVATWCHLSTGNLTHWPNVQKKQILQVQRSPQGSLNRFVWPKQQRETTAIIPWILWLFSDMFLCDTFHDHRKNGSTF